MVTASSEYKMVPALGEEREIDRSLSVKELLYP
jgi:hypothetical protein